LNAIKESSNLCLAISRDRDGASKERKSIPQDIYLLGLKNDWKLGEKKSSAKNDRKDCEDQERFLVRKEEEKEKSEIRDGGRAGRKGTGVDCDGQGTLTTV
jgi:hypothetical protein